MLANIFEIAGNIFYFIVTKFLNLFKKCTAILSNKSKVFVYIEHV